MIKILFIGNSHTYFNDMPAMVAELFEEVLGQEAHVTMLASPGVPLRWHIDQPQTAFNILHGGYDYVVLQQATHPFDGEEALMRQASQLLELIHQAKATPVAYMTWAREEAPEDQAELTDAFERLAREENMLLGSGGCCLGAGAESGHRCAALLAGQASCKPAWVGTGGGKYLPRNYRRGIA